MTQPPPDDRSGSQRPRRAADACRAMALLLLIAGIIAGIIGGNADVSPALAWIPAASGILGAFWAWVASVLLEWAAALYEELRRE